MSTPYLDAEGVHFPDVEPDLDIAREEQQARDLEEIESTELGDNLGLDLVAALERRGASADAALAAADVLVAYGYWRKDNPDSPLPKTLTRRS